MITGIQNQNNIVFGRSLKANKRLGEEVLYAFRKEFGHPRSDSWVETRLGNLSPRNYSSARSKFAERLSDYSRDLLQLRNNFIREAKKTTESAVKLATLKTLVKSRRLGACTEQSIMVHQDLLARGEKAYRVGMSNDLHVFTVFGLKDGANPETPWKDVVNPKTGEKHKVWDWGHKAVIVDPWAGVVGEAKATLEYLMEFLGCSKSTCRFENVK